MHSAVTSAILALCAALFAVPGCGGKSQKRDDGNRASGEQPTARVATDDGLALTFDRRTKTFTGWSLSAIDADTNWPAPSPQALIGVSLSDHHGQPVLAATGEFVLESSFADESLRIVRARPDRGVRVTETWTAHARHLALHATVALTEPEPSGPEPSGPMNESRSRAIEACVHLPMDAAGKLWHHHLQQAELIEPGQTYQTVLEPSVDIGHFSRDGLSSHLKSKLPFNLHGINAITTSDAGLAVAMDPAAPGAYYAAYDDAAKTLRACFHLSIYRDHKKRPDSADLRLVFMNIDQPASGLRSALAEYMEIFAPWFRGRLPRQTGMTVGGGYRHDIYPRPADFHIAAMWNGYRPQNRPNQVQNLLYAWPTGYLERGLNLSVLPTDGPCAYCDRSIDAHVKACMQLYQDYEDGSVRFPQTCTDTWSRDNCRASLLPPTKERRYGPVLIRKYFYHLVPHQVTEPTNLALRLLGKFPLREPLAHSILHGPDARHQGALSDSMGLMAVPGTPGLFTCYINGLNPDPGVQTGTGTGRPAAGSDENRPPVNFGQLNLEIAKRATGLYGEAYLGRRRDQTIRFDGVALDTVGAYLRPDYNPDMLAVASYPLAYDPVTGAPVALEHLGLSAFIDQLRSQLAPDVSIAINGMPVSGALGAGVDHFVRELIRRWRKKPGDLRPKYYYELYDEDFDLRLRRVHRLRMVAGQRPITFWARFLHTEKRAKERGASPEQVLLTDMRALLPLYTATGVYVYIQRTGISKSPRFLGARQDPGLMTEYRRHLDTVAALTRAGWQPVPHARAVAQTTDRDRASKPVLIERFGASAAGVEHLLTLYNPSEHELRVALTIDWATIGHGQKLASVRDWHSGEALPTQTGGDQSGAVIQMALTLPGNAVRVVVLKP